MYQLIFSCLKGCSWTPLNPLEMHHKGVKNYMELSISIYRTVGIEFPSLYALFWEQKKDHLGVISINRIKCSVGNFRVDQNWDITIFFQGQKWLISSTYNFWCFGAKIQIFEDLAITYFFRRENYPIGFKGKFWVWWQNSGFHWEKPQKSPALNALERWESLWPSL